MTQQERDALIRHLFETRPGPQTPWAAPAAYAPWIAATTVEPRTLSTRAGDTPVWLVSAKARPRPSAVFVNIHGGGFIAPHMERDIAFSQRLAAELGILVVDISYRTAGEAAFPVACHEAYDCVQWVYAHAAELGADPARLMVGGHSAGANLTAGICLQARQSHAFQPALQVLDYPPLDLFTDPAAKPDADKTLIPPDRARSFNLLYLGSEAAARDPLASPVLTPPALLAGQPEAVVITAGHDNLRFEGERYAAQLAAAGVPVHVRRFTRSGHGFVIACQDEYDAAIAFMEEAMRAVIARGALPPAELPRA